MEKVQKDSWQIRKLTNKQRAFLVEYFKNGGNAVKAAMATYDTTNYATAGNIGYKNLKNLKEPVRTYLEAQGLSLGTLLGVLAQGLKATKTVSAIKTDKDASAATTDFIEVPDHPTRHKYLETAAKWLGVEKSELEMQKADLTIQIIKDFIPEDRLETLQDSGATIIEGKEVE